MAELLDEYTIDTEPAEEEAPITADDGTVYEVDTTQVNPTGPVRDPNVPTGSEQTATAIEGLYEAQEKRNSDQARTNRLQHYQSSMKQMKTERKAFTAADKQVVADINMDIYEGLKESGEDVTMQNGTIMVMSEETGKYQALTPDGFKDMWASKGEYAGAMAGAHAGSKVPGPWFVKLGASLAGGFVGAAGGSTMDTMSNAITYNQRMKDLPWVSNAMVAGTEDFAFAGAGEVVLRSVGNLGKAVYKAFGGEDLGQAKQYINDLVPDMSEKEIQNTTEDYLRTFGAEGEKIIAMGPNSRDYTRASLEAIATTDPRFIKVMNSAMQDDKTALGVLGRVEQRKEYMNEFINSKKQLTNGQYAKDEILDLEKAGRNLQSDVEGTISSSFNGSALPMQMSAQVQLGTKEFVEEYVMKNTRFEASLGDKKVADSLKQVMRLSTQVDSMQGLLNLRRSYQGLMNKIGANEDTVSMAYLGKLDDTIDAMIENNSLLSKSEASQMKETYHQTNRMVAETNAGINTKLAKDLKAGDKHSDQLVDRFLQYAKSDSGEFEKAANVMSADTREKLENTMVARLASKFIKDGAVDYGTLSKEFDSIAPRLRSKSAQDTLAVTKRMSEVFANDTLLSNAAEVATKKMKSADAEGDFLNKKSGSIATTIPGKIQMAKTKTVWDMMQAAGNRLIGAVVDTLAGGPLTGGITKKLLGPMVEQRHASAMVESIQRVMTKEHNDFRGFASDLAQIENLPPEMAAGIKDFMKVYEDLQSTMSRAVKGKSNQAEGPGIGQKSTTGDNYFANSNQQTKKETRANRTANRDAQEAADYEKVQSVVDEWFDGMGKKQLGVQTSNASNRMTEYHRRMQSATDETEKAKWYGKILDQAKEEGILVPKVVSSVEGFLKPRGAGELGMDVAKPTVKKPDASATSQLNTTEKKGSMMEGGIDYKFASQDVARARAGRKALWKGEAISGSNKTWDDVYDQVKATMTEKEAMSTVDKLTKLKSKKEVNQALRDMGLDGLDK